MNSSATSTDEPQATISWDLFHGEVTSIKTTVYARVRLADTGRDCQLRGTLRGPYSAASQTLPASFQLTDCGPGPTLLAKSCVTDPCAWSPRVPAIYRVRLQVLRAEKVIHELIGEFGIRELVASGRSLKLSGQRVVLRGVGLSHAVWETMQDWREHNSVLFADEPADSLCRQATEQGVLIFARLTGADRLDTRLRRIAHYPSVCVVWIDNATIDKTLKAAAPNVLLAANLEDVANRERADLIVWEVGNSIDHAHYSIDKPTIALRPLAQRRPLVDARAASDVLQRDLAPQYDLAGYFV